MPARTWTDGLSMAFFKRNRFPAAGRAKTPVPDGLWMKCEGCRDTVYRSEVDANFRVCPACGYHYRIGARDRIVQVSDPGTFRETHTNVRTLDPLNFAVGGETYLERIARAQQESGLDEALIAGFAEIDEFRVALGVMDAAFIMASMGCALGEKFCLLAEDAINEHIPLVVFAASGGARMQEGTLALMQMAKTADAVRRLNEAAVPYISVLTDPTTGGVLASFASLGDVVLAEPDAYIGFAGQRLIAGALNVELPPGFQRSEYQFQHGFIDQIVKRADLRAVLARLLRCLAPAPARPDGAGQ